MSDPYDADFDEDGQEVAAANWTWGKAPISCPQLKQTESSYDFDNKKADKIFDLLLEKKHLRLPANHVVLLARELKVKKYYKFHNATNHNTNECRIFRLHIQKSTE